MNKEGVGSRSSLRSLSGLYRAACGTSDFCSPLVDGTSDESVNVKAIRTRHLDAARRSYALPSINPFLWPR